MSEPSDTTWWGEYEIAVGQTGRLRIGPTTLTIQHLEREWRLVCAYDGGEDVGVEIAIPCPDEVEVAVATKDAIRFGTASDSDRISLTPALADRSVVVRPERPFSVAPDDAVTVYVSTPLWAQLRLGADGVLLHEMAIVRPSDTWFGPSPRVGELCYASRTFCRLHLRNVAASPLRARTAVQIDNHDAQPLLIERVKLPVRYMSLSQATDDSLWTESLRLKNRGEAEPAPIEFDAASVVAAGTNPLAPPRDPDRANVVERAFQMLVRHRG